MNALTWWRRPQPEPEDNWLDEPTFMRRDGEWRSGLRSVRYRPLEWTSQIPTIPGWYFWRHTGEQDVDTLQLKAGMHFAPVDGFEYAGPLPEPRP